MAGRDEIVVEYSERVEDDATFCFWFHPVDSDEPVFVQGIWYH